MDKMARVDVRLSSTEREQLEFLSNETGASYTEIFRAGIHWFMLQPQLLVALYGRKDVPDHQDDADE